MKVIFLDIDGVLNHVHLRKRLRDAGETGVLTWRLATECVEALNQITDKSGACLVISSAWRTMWRLPDLRTHLREQGVTGRVIGYTQESWDGDRGADILAWLQQRHREPVECFVALDDDPVRGLPDGALVRTDYTLGLTGEDARQALQVLGAGGAQ